MWCKSDQSLLCDRELHQIGLITTQTEDYTALHWRAFTGWMKHSSTECVDAIYSVVASGVFYIVF